MRSRGEELPNDFLLGNCPAVNFPVPVIFRKAIRDRTFEPFAAALTTFDRSTVEISSFVILLFLSRAFFFDASSLSLSPFLLPRSLALQFLQPFRIRAFDPTLNSFSKRCSTTLSKKKQESGGKSDREKRRWVALTVGLQTGMESKKLRNDEQTRYFGCTRHERLRREERYEGKRRRFETEQQKKKKKKTSPIRSSKLKTGSVLIQMCWWPNERTIPLLRISLGKVYISVLTEAKS